MIDRATKKELLALIAELEAHHRPLTEAQLVDSSKLPSFAGVFEHRVVGKAPLDHSFFEELHEGPHMDDAMTRCPLCRQVLVLRRLRELVSSV